MSEMRRAGSGVAGIGGAIAVASVAGYALLTLVGRMLTPAQFGLFVVFWGVLFGLGGSLSTIEQETARRTVTGDEASAPAVGTVTAAAAVLAALVASLTLLPPVAVRLYGDANTALGIVVVLAVLGVAVHFAVRGVLIGSGSVRSYAGIIVAEAAIRLVLLAVVAASVGLTLTNAAIVVAAGSFAWLLWFDRARSVLRSTGHRLREWWDAARRASSLMVGAALTSVVITGYPTLVTALTGEVPGSAGGAVFAALTISRVPLLLVYPLQAVAVPAVVRWRAEDRAVGGSRLQRALIGGTLAAAVLAAVGGAVGWQFGPWVVELVYGSAYTVARSTAALLILSAFLLAWVLLMSAALIAFAAVRRMVLMWLIATGLTAVWLTLSPLNVAETTAIGALIGPLAGIVCGLPMLWSLTSASADLPREMVTTVTGGDDATER